MRSSSLKLVDGRTCRRPLIEQGRLAGALKKIWYRLLKDQAFDPELIFAFDGSSGLMGFALLLLFEA